IESRWLPMIKKLLVGISPLAVLLAAYLLVPRYKPETLPLDEVRQVAEADGDVAGEGEGPDSETDATAGEDAVRSSGGSQLANFGGAEGGLELAAQRSAGGGGSRGSGGGGRGGSS